MTGPPVRVLIVDDDALMRAGLRAVLSSDERIAVAGEAGDGAAAVARGRELAPDVVLMDVRMPGVDGIAATRELLAVAPDARVLILTTFEQDDYVFGALRAGASGFLLKRARPEELIAAVRAVADGDALLSPSVTRTVIDRLATAEPPRGASEAGRTSSPSSRRASARSSRCSPAACRTPRSPPPSSSRSRRSRRTSSGC